MLDDGTGGRARRRRHVGGHGLIGMRERVGLHGGHLAPGHAAGGGFAVRATFPLTGDRDDDDQRSSSPTTRRWSAPASG